jgi:hypothetical protein
LAPSRPVSVGEIEARPDAIGLWPANSFFDVFAEVDLPLLGGNPGNTTVYNTAPLLVENENLTCVPPKLVYSHKHTGPVPVVFKADDTQLPKRWLAGDRLGWLVLAGHGFDFDTTATAPLLGPRGGPSTRSSPIDEFIQLVDAEPEMADTATLVVDVHDVIAFTPLSAYVLPAYRDSLSNGFAGATAKALAGDPCGAIRDLVYKLLVRVDGVTSTPDWVQDSTVRAVTYAKINALAEQYQAQANAQGGCTPLTVPMPAPAQVAIQYIRPNPTAGFATIQYGLPQRSRVRLAIFDLTGRQVRVIVDGDQPAGVHQATWDGRSDVGSVTPNGIYFARLTARGITDTKSIVMMK